MAKKNEASTENGQERSDQSGVGNASSATKAIAAAAATGAVTYAARRALRHRESGGSDEEQGGGEMSREEREDQNNDDEKSARRRLSEKKDDLAETLTSKASEVKKAAGRLRPTRDQSIAATAWNAASGSVLPVVEEAAAAVGKAAADKAPAAVRDKLIPRFIEAFEESR
jgi:hypothetical protein